jgi:hypothetical protein
MRNVLSCAAVGVLMSSGIAAAQFAPVQPTPQEAREFQESRYQIGQMERLLEGAVEHGATLMRNRLRAVLPADMLLTENARARGFRLQGYGLFFDVEVPSLEGPLPWSFQTLDQNDLGIQAALQTLRSYIQGSAANDTNLQQAMKRVELQVAPIGVMPMPAGSVSRDGSAQQPPANGDLMTQAQANQAYRSTISNALIDAMLEHSRGLGIGASEWLTVAARGSENRPRLAPADPEGQTVLISVQGSDISAFLGGQLTRDEALKRIQVRVF